jgi:hypothetical protein
MDSVQPLRKIIHIDMDAFYASVEQRDNPELRGKPLAVGGSAARGVVAAASYEARTFGVHSAMPSVTAKRKCPDLIFVPPRFEVYRQVSLQIREIFAEYTSLIEPLSLDEAYLDVTENLKGMDIATEIALEIRARIKVVTGLNASAGISYNKFLAKIASDLNKPNGQAVITPKNGPGFVEALPVKKFHGVGPATAERMRQYGIETGFDLKSKSDIDMILEIAETLLASVFPFKRPVRLLGITLSSLNTEDSGREPQFVLDSDATALKTKKPAAGGGAAGFPKRTEQRLGGGVPLFRQTPLGRRSGPSEIEALREEVHRFDETKIPILSAH